jgi:hypothetical protein
MTRRLTHAEFEGRILAILVVGGSAKDIGKTALVCAIIAALREFEWTAVKITAHDYEPANSGKREGGISNQAVFEDTSAGDGTDTARYLVAGARRALLARRYGADAPIEEIRNALAGDRNVIFESNRIVDVVKPDVCLALTGGAEAEAKASFARLLRVADALVSLGAGEIESAMLRDGVTRFALKSADTLLPEMAMWLRERLR